MSARCSKRGCRRERRTGTHHTHQRSRHPAARQRHGHRSDHARPLPAGRVVRRARRPSVRGRQEDQRRSIRSTTRATRARPFSWSTRTSAADPRASTRRRASCATAFARSSASRSRRSSSATRRCSACRASAPSTRAIDELQSLLAATPTVIVEADVESGVVTAGALRLTATVPPAFRDAFLSGQWNPTSMLLDSSTRSARSRIACPTSAGSNPNASKRAPSRSVRLQPDRAEADEQLDG